MHNRCFIDYSVFDINISKTVFENNSGSNGGVMFFNETSHDTNGINDDKYSLNITDSIFKKNNAYYFGGAIFSNFDITHIEYYKVLNVSFIENHAYAGGAIYLNNINNNSNNTFCELKNDNIEYEGNTATSHGKDFATSPYLIELSTNKNKKFEITSGTTFPLEFTLLDKFGQKIIDISKYYSNIILNIKNIKDDFNSDIKIVRNICYFTKGNS